MRFFTLNPLHNFPLEKDRTDGIFSGGLPEKVAVGSLRDKPVVDVGFEDTFGREHWASRKSVVKERPSSLPDFPSRIGAGIETSEKPCLRVFPAVERGRDRHRFDFRFD